MDRIAVVADSHDNLRMIERAVAVINGWGADLVVHCGDYVAPFTAESFRKLNAPLRGVFGNNDGDRPALKKAYAVIGDLNPDPYRFTFNGFSMLITHKPRLAREAAVGAGYDLIAFGHDHHVRVEHGESLVICPGELGGWVTGRASIALVEVKIANVDVEYL
ncbi:MAG: YfcE family phosphodiesterase [candidate division Zixibacteria bacterium]|nr:YfcE family phosphodiesterase [candidate division Zixibacteria bacterium]